MARKVLTDRAIKALKAPPPGKRAEVLDAIVPGLGIRCTDRGVKSFFLRARFPGASARNHPTRRLLGVYRAISLDEARDKARAWHELLTAGVDPGKAGPMPEKRLNADGRTTSRRLPRHSSSTVTGRDSARRALWNARSARNSFSLGAIDRSQKSSRVT